MLKRERLLTISEMVNKKGILTVSEIIEQLNVSDMTVRRDLDELENQENYCVSMAGPKVSPIPSTKNYHIQKNQSCKSKKSNRLQQLLHS